MASRSPRANRVPGRYAGKVALINEYAVDSWGPVPPGQGPPTEVHMVVTAPAFPLKALLRLRSPDELDTLIAALEHHRALVWPHEPRKDGGG